MAVSLAVALAVGCTGEGTREVQVPSAATQASPLLSATDYVYTDVAGIEARLRVQDAGATLSIMNGTGATLAVPGLYVLDARDGTRVSWSVLEAVPVPDDETVEFSVRRPPDPGADDIGLVGMLFGGDDYGAFLPPQPDGRAVP